MHDRLGALDGRVSITTAPHRGTIVSGSLPLRARKSRRGKPITAAQS
jgi:hypothetical protein